MLKYLSGEKSGKAAKVYICVDTILEEMKI